MSVSGSCAGMPRLPGAAYEATRHSHVDLVLTELSGWESSPIRPSGERRRLQKAASSLLVFWPRKYFGDAWAGFAISLHPAAAWLWWWADFWAPGTGEEEPELLHTCCARVSAEPFAAAARGGSLGREDGYGAREH